MSLIRSMEDLAQARADALELRRARSQEFPFEVRVGMSSCGIAVGARDTWQTFESLITSREPAGVRLTQIGCMGLCALEPIVQVQAADRPLVVYGKVTPEVARRIFEEHIEKGLVVQEYAVEDF
jgi:NADP-reducing hydrogenase subunit HndB